MEDGQMINIFAPNDSGFKTVFKSNGWQIATITYSEQYSKAGFNHMKKHLTTDEVFVLLKGEAVLHTIENNNLTEIKLEKEKIYCVLKNTWHYLEISEDALLCVTENSDLLPQQSEKEDIECLLQKK